MCDNIITTYLCVNCDKKLSTGTEATYCADALRHGDKAGFGEGCLMDRDIKVSKRHGRCTRCTRIHREKERREEERQFEEQIRREKEEAKRERERREEEERRAREDGDGDYGYFSSVMYARR
jgi:hypothetical protein